MGKAALALAAIVAFCSPAVAQESTPRGFAFKDASIETILLYVSRATGWIFVQEAPARGTITAYSRADLPPGRYLEFLDASLRSHGLALRHRSWPNLPLPGETIRVVEAARAAATQLGVYVGMEAAEIPATDDPRTQILPLQHLAAAEVMKDLGDVFRKAVGDGGQIAVSSTSNAIVLSGRSEGIRRVAEILMVLDRTASAQLQIAYLPLVYAEAVQTAKMFNEFWKREPARAEAGGQVPGFLRLMRPGPEGGAPSRSIAHEMIRITAEPRTNALVVSATDQNLELIRTMLRHIDRPEAAMNTYVVPLRNSDAASLAAILDAAWNGKSKAATPGQARSDGTAPPGQAPSTSPGARQTTRTTPRR